MWVLFISWYKNREASTRGKFKKPDYLLLEVLALEILQGIGVSMDATFLLHNKPESETFVLEVNGNII